MGAQRIYLSCRSCEVPFLILGGTPSLQWPRLPRGAVIVVELTVGRLHNPLTSREWTWVSISGLKNPPSSEVKREEGRKEGAEEGGRRREKLKV